MELEEFKRRVIEIAKNGDLEKSDLEEECTLTPPLDMLYHYLYLSSNDAFNATIVKLFNIKGHTLLGRVCTIKEVKKFVENLDDVPQKCYEHPEIYGKIDTRALLKEIGHTTFLNDPSCY